MLTDEQVLDVIGSQRAESYRFDLLDQNLNDVGEIDVSLDETVSIDNDSDRAIKRQMQGVKLSASDTTEVNPLVHRLSVKMVLPSGERYPLGVFMFSSNDKRRRSWGREPTPQFTDLGRILDQPTPTTFSAAPGAKVTDLLEQWLADLPVRYVIAENDAKVSATTAQGWPAGTSRLDPLNGVSALAGFSSAWFDAEGLLHFEPPPGLDDPTHVYELGPTSRVIEDSIVESDSWLDAPNRYIVVDSSNTTEPVVGVFDVPDSAPNSAAKIGYVNAVRIDAQGAGTAEQAVKVAKARYRQARQYEWITFGTPADPRHETFDVVQLDGLRYRESGWKMTLKPGAPMEHECRRTYA